VQGEILKMMTAPPNADVKSLLEHNSDLSLREKRAIAAALKSGRNRECSTYVVIERVVDGCESSARADAPGAQAP
jgi:hypothetical protein